MEKKNTEDTVWGSKIISGKSQGLNQKQSILHGTHFLLKKRLKQNLKLWVAHSVMWQIFYPFKEIVSTFQIM